MGGSWYYAPQRWGTSDGCAPYAVTVMAYHALQSQQAADRLSMIRATVLANAEPDQRAQHLRHEESLVLGEG